MLHVTTEIGKPGRQERERRHFPGAHNQPGEIPPFKPRGRRYLPHSRGKEEEWVPHNQSIDVEYTVAGPDWSSKLKYIPHPENPEYPAAEIWPNNWRSMRPYPFTYRRSKDEWLLDPGLTKVGLRCIFDGVHKATDLSEAELTHQMLYGKGRNKSGIDNRNELSEASPGDKSYQAPEYSPSFHQNNNSNTPRQNYVTSSTQFIEPKMKADTFIPLVPLPVIKKEPYRKTQETKLRQNDIEEVKKLEVWQPAKPISSTIPVLDPADMKRY